MSDKTKGIIQLVFVIAFIAGSFAISGLLSAIQPEIGKSVSTDRTLFVETRNIIPDEYRIHFSATGTIQARGNVNIVPEVSGRITQINDQLFEGGMFEAGDVLFQIEPRDFELEIKRLEAEIARANTALDLEQAEAKAALAEWKQLNGSKPAPDLVARRPQMAEARASLQAAEAQLEDAKLNLERASFSFPFNGRVLSSSLDNGQYVMAGQSYGQVFAMDTLEIKSSLEGQQLEWLLNAIDPEITITANYLGKTQKYEGYLKRGASSLDAQTRFATVSFGFKDDNVNLLPGIFADIEIRGSRLNNVLLFPAEALQKEGQIWLVDDENKLVRYEPEIIYAGDKEVVVRAQGNESLNAVVNKLAGATEGTAVEINNEASMDEEMPLPENESNQE